VDREDLALLNLRLPVFPRVVRDVRREICPESKASFRFLLQQAFPVSVGRELVKKQLEEIAELHTLVVELFQVRVEGREGINDGGVVQVERHACVCAVVYMFSGVSVLSLLPRDSTISFSNLGLCQNIDLYADVMPMKVEWPAVMSGCTSTTTWPEWYGLQTRMDIGTTHTRFYV